MPCCYNFSRLILPKRVIRPSSVSPLHKNRVYINHRWDDDGKIEQYWIQVIECSHISSCAHISSFRRQLLLPVINRKIGVVTTDSSASTHCAVAIPFARPSATRLLKKYGVPASCQLVSEIFICPIADHRSEPDMVAAPEALRLQRKLTWWNIGSCGK